jgi:hypothetical protein
MEARALTLSSGMERAILYRPFRCVLLRDEKTHKGSFACYEEDHSPARERLSEVRENL